MIRRCREGNLPILKIPPSMGVLDNRSYPQAGLQKHLGVLGIRASKDYRTLSPALPVGDLDLESRPE